MAKLVTILGTTLLVAGAATTALQASEIQERALRQAMGYAKRGLYALEKGNSARAAEDFTRALAQIPDLPDAHAGLGHVAMQQHRFDDALTEYRLAQQFYTSFVAARIDLAQQRYSKTRDQIQMLSDAKNVVEREQMRAQVRGGALGNGASTSEGRLQREKLEYEQEISRLESQTQVIPALEGVVSEPPASYYFFEANALFNLKRNEEAIAAWQRAVERDPNYGVAFNNLAVAYWKQGRLDDAQASLARADALGFKVNPSFRADLEKSVGQRKTQATH
jgi:tetratricopeptide (TPR) repeat protein